MDLLSGYTRIDDQIKERYTGYSRLDETSIRWSNENIMKDVISKAELYCTDEQTRLVNQYQYMMGYTSAKDMSLELGYEIRQLQRIKNRLVNNDASVILNDL